MHGEIYAVFLCVALCSLCVLCELIFLNFLGWQRCIADRSVVP